MVVGIKENNPISFFKRRAIKKKIFDEDGNVLNEKEFEKLKIQAEKKETKRREKLALKNNNNIEDEEQDDNDDDDDDDENDDERIQIFLNETVVVKDQIETTCKDIAKLDGLYVQLINTASSGFEELIRDDIEDMRNLIDISMSNMRDKLAKWKRETGTLTLEDITLFRVRENMVNVLSAELMDMVQRYRTMLSKWDDILKKRAMKNVRIVAPELDNCQVMEALESDGVKQVFAQKVMQDRKGEQTLQLLQEKRDDIRALEKSLAELNQIFTDMALLTETADEPLEVITQDLSTTKAHTGKAISHLHAAKRYVYATRKKKIICLVICGLVILLVAGIIVAVVCVVAL